MPTPRSLLITLLAALLVFGAAVPSSAQSASGARITPNFKDADITQVIEAVAAAIRAGHAGEERVERDVYEFLERMEGLGVLALAEPRK